MIYADHNATSPMDPAVLEAMRPFFSESFHNPASPYTPARRAALAIGAAREQLAALVDAAPGGIVFTSGGTEANATALHAARAWNPGRRHWVCSAVEHASVLAPMDELERAGHRVTRVPVDREGRLDWGELEACLSDETALVSVMIANNETGALFDVARAAALARARGIPFHADAAQAVGRIPVSFRRLGADLMTCCAHKLHGPKGAGALVVRPDRARAPLLAGGGQEHGWRAGTENVPAIAGFGCAAERAGADMPRDMEHTRALRDCVERGVAERIDGAQLVARTSPRLPNTSLFLIPDMETDVLLAALDMAGACCSSGSACASGSSEPSRVLRAMGLTAAGAAAALRVSWGRFNTPAEANRLVALIADSIRDIRSRVGR